MGNDNHIIEQLNQTLAEVERHAARLRAAIAVLRDSANHSLPLTNPGPSAGVTPPIGDICAYMEGRGIVSQNEIIRTVGALRAQRYPALSNHYNNVWRALEYHLRHKRLIQCVNEAGNETEPKPLPKRSKAKKLPDSAELYDVDNYFVLREEKDAAKGRLRIEPKDLSLFKRE